MNNKKFTPFSYYADYALKKQMYPDGEFWGVSFGTEQEAREYVANELAYNLYVDSSLSYDDVMNGFERSDSFEYNGETITVLRH